MTTAGPPPRERGQSRKSYRAFVAWWRLRSIRKAAKELGRSRQLLERYSVRDRWVERKKAIDLERRRERRDVDEIGPSLSELDRLLATMEEGQVRR